MFVVRFFFCPYIFISDFLSWIFSKMNLTSYLQTDYIFRYYKMNELNYEQFKTITDFFPKLLYAEIHVPKCTNSFYIVWKKNSNNIACISADICETISFCWCLIIEIDYLWHAYRNRRQNSISYRICVIEKLVKKNISREKIVCLIFTDSSMKYILEESLKIQVNNLCNIVSNWHLR